MKLSPLFIAVTMVAALAHGTASAEGHKRLYSDTKRPVAPVFVRVTNLLATGPDGKQHTLFADPKGKVVPLMRMSQLGEAMGTEGLPRGAYYNLEAGLANTLTVAAPGGQRVTRPYTEGGPAPKLSLAGAVLVNENGAQALGLVPQFIIDNQHAFNRPRKYERWGHDDDREDDDD